MKLILQMSILIGFVLRQQSICSDFLINKSFIFYLLFLHNVFNLFESFQSFLHPKHYNYITVRLVKWISGKLTVYAIRTVIKVFCILRYKVLENSVSSTL